MDGWIIRYVMLSEDSDEWNVDSHCGRSHGNVCKNADLCRRTTETLKTVMKCDVLKYTPTHYPGRLPVYELIQ